MGTLGRNNDMAASVLRKIKASAISHTHNDHQLNCDTFISTSRAIRDGYYDSYTWVSEADKKEAAKKGGDVYTLSFKIGHLRFDFAGSSLGVILDALVDDDA